MKKKLLLCDLVIAKDLCNASCRYCLTNYDQFSDNQKALLRRQYQYQDGVALYWRLNTLLDTLEDNLEIAALKISGGEILMVPNIIQLLEERASRYYQVQMMTNGILLNAQSIRRLSKIPNLFLQVSIDSDNLKGNYYRIQQPKKQSRLLENVDAVITAGIPLEINSVLTDLSLPYFPDFLDYLLRYRDRPLTVFPFPVRGDEVARYFPREDQIPVLTQILERYDQYQFILPPRPYMDNLITFLQEKKRQRLCTVPFHSAQFFDNGQFTPCPYWWTVDFGNIIDEGAEPIKQYRTNPIYRSLLARKPCLKPCQHCYVHAEVLNLYFEDRLSSSALMTIPFYRSSQMIQFVNNIKEEYHSVAKGNLRNG